VKSASPLKSTRDTWQAAFPLQESQHAATFLQETWRQLVKNKPELFYGGQREDKLTEKLSAYLIKLCVGKGHLTGFWGNEDRLPYIDTDSSGLTKVKSIRKDITYKSNASTTRLDLIFEFKKMSADKTSVRNYRGKDGMGRFVLGQYAHGQPIAVMVAMLIDNPKTCISMLKKSLLSTAARDDLRMVSRGENQYVFEPSMMLPNIAHFDTEHNRPPEIAASHGTIILSHMFLLLPENC
jgi:hypothetical protein